MRLLHTGDWHAGKRLYGVERLAETRAALAEMAEIASREAVDAVLLSGDLLDRRLFEPAPLAVVMAGLAGLAAIAPVVAITGNHDDPDIWAELAPYLAGHRIHMMADLRADPRSGTVSINTAAGPLHVACLPWPDPARLDLALSARADAARGRYADDVPILIDRYCDHLRALRAEAGGAAVLMAHLMVDRALSGGGERELTLGITYAISPHALPVDLDYVALGHVHRAQPIPGFGAPGGYAGSPIALDFSEHADPKGVTIIELGDRRVPPRHVPLTAGRPLVRLRGPLDALAARAADHPGAYFLCQVELAGPEPDLVQRVRERVPDTLRVEPITAVTPGEAPAPPDALEPARRIEDDYADWQRAIGRPLDPALAAALLEAIADAAMTQAG